jgi:DNA-binding NarL/FixJ family response regulator
MRLGGERSRLLATQLHRTAVLFDPHPLWLNALESILGSIDVTVVGRTTSPEDALELVEKKQPDILICETETLNDGMSGRTLIRACRERLSTLRVVVLGASRDQGDIDAAFNAGALAYAVKTAPPEDVAATVRQTFDHTIFLAPSTSTNGSAHSSLSHVAARGEAGEDVALTRREREILALVAEGRSNREVARMLWVTEQTVKFHLSNIYRKLDVANRTEASHWAHRDGLMGAATAVPLPASA